MIIPDNYPIEDTVEVRKYINLSSELINADPDKSLKYADTALILAEKAGWIEGRLFSLSKIGTAYYYKGDYTKALDFYNKGLSIAKELDNKREAGKITGNIGAVYRAMADYNKAIENYLTALRIAEETEDNEGISINLGNIGIAYESLSNYPKALEYFELALKSAEASGDNNEIRRHLTNIGILYYDLDNYRKALEYYNKALIIAEESGDNKGCGYCLSNIGVIYWKLSDFHKALECYSKALKIAEETGDKNNIGINFGNCGIVYAQMYDYPKALEYYNKALNIAYDMNDKSGIGVRLGNIGSLYFRMATDTVKKPGVKEKEVLLANSSGYLEKAIHQLKEINDLDYQGNFLSALSDTYIELQDYHKALETYKEASKIKDSIFSGENQKKIAELEAKRENELKQKEIEILQQKNQIQSLDLTRQYQALALLESRQKLQNLELVKRNNELSLLQKDNELTNLELKQINLESEKKEREVKLLNKEKKYQSMVNRSLTGGLIFTVAIIILLFLFFQRKHKANKILADKSLIIERANDELTILNKNLTEKNTQIVMQKELIERSHDIIQSGIDQAKDYVMSLLPRKINEGPVQTDWLFLPSDQLGGDAFGYHQIDEYHFAFYILDVCGHGIGAALHSVSILHFIRSGTQLSVDPRKPELVLNSLNNTFQSEDHNGLFFTMWYGVFDHTNNELNYVCAGHPTPLLLHENGKVIPLDPPAISVGCIPGISYKPQKVKITNKSLLYLFSDGVYEIFRPDGKSMLVDEFYNILRESGVNGASLQYVFDKVAGFQNSTHFEDDFSLIKIIIHK
jgi:serine phosphatase RsbU (regulator of sigma subunit)